MTFEASYSSSEPNLLTQGDHKGLVRDLNLSDKRYEPLVCRLKEWNLLHQGNWKMFLSQLSK